MKAEIKGVGLHADDLQRFDVYGGSKQDEMWFHNDAGNHHHNGVGDEVRNHLLDVDVDVDMDMDMDVSDPSSLFYADEFPALPDFPCMSSSSSSSSAPAPTANKFASTATSSSASTASSGVASWAADHDPSTSVSMDLVAAPPPHETVGSMSTVVDQCMDMMENFGCIDLLESGDICWDPSPLLEQNNNHLHQQKLEREEEERVFKELIFQGDSASCDTDVYLNEVNNNNINNKQQQQQQQQQQEEDDEESPSSDDLAMVFFEWLMTNKETISNEDLRNIKIKKSTIEAAAKRLGGGKEGMKQLLKLILQWVQNHHLQNKRVMVRDSSIVANTISNDNNTITCGPLAEDQNNTTNNISNNNNSIHDPTDITPNPNPIPIPIPNPPALDQQAWLPAPFVSDPIAVIPPPAPVGLSPMVGYMGTDPYSDYTQMVDSTAHTWAPFPYGMGPQYSPYPDPGHAAQFGGYGNPYPAPGFYYHPGPGDHELVRFGSSVTKEARKKRMARQRRFFTHHHRSHHHHNQIHDQNNQQNQTAEQHAGVGNVNCGAAPHPGHGNWVYWPHHPAPPPPPPQHQVSHPVGGSAPLVGQMQPLDRPVPPSNGFQRQLGVEKKQGWKTDKNLRFLLQKVLKQSDVGNLGRIVLPKKEAEMHLPELEVRDGIPIAMEDIGTSRVWNMRYRFWPNNKSRMYLLENTGDFVRSNELQEGDFIVIYSDVKCGKYMIRGVKVRQQQQGVKPETTNKKPSKTQKTPGSSFPAENHPLSSPTSMHK